MYNNNQPYTQQQQPYYNNSQPPYQQQQQPPQYSYPPAQGAPYPPQPYPQQYQQQQAPYQQQQQYPPSGKQHFHQGSNQSSNATAGGNYGGPSTSSVKINPKPKYNDVWATILFVLVLLSYIAVAYFGISYLRVNFDSLGQFVKDNLRPLLISFFLSVIIGLVLTVIYFFLMQSFAGKMIVATGVIMILLNLAVAVFFILSAQWVPGIILLLFTLLYAYLFYSWRHRIPFAKIMLKTVTRVTGQFPATLFTGFMGLLVGLVFSTFFGIAIAGWAAMASNRAVTSGALYGIIFYSLFVLYWVSEVIKNVVHVTISGLFAAFYFLGTPDPTRPGKVKVSVRNPTVKSFGRAMTTSFGSICYGSLIVALIQTLRAVVRSAASNAQQEGNLFAVFCLFCLDCVLSWIDALAQYFNHYAFTQVAIYGKDYCTAGKDTWTLIKSRGIDAIINDDLISNVLRFGTLFVALIAGGAAALYLRFSTDGLQNDIGAIAVMGLLGVVIGIVEFSIMAETIYSGVAATFVCLAEDPAALRRTKPELFEKIAQVYPQVLS